jgi:hypothetical protein
VAATGGDERQRSSPLAISMPKACLLLSYLSDPSDTVSYLKCLNPIL